IMLVASINYTNLATARAAKRANEIGMRKVLGARRSPLAAQFLVEAVLLAVTALVIGIALAKVFVAVAPTADLFGKTLELDLATAPRLLAALLAGTVVVGLLSGLYPALYLSAMPPIGLAGRRGAARRGGIRLFLIFLQFTVSVCVIACTLLMASQMRFIA